MSKGIDKTNRKRYVVSMVAHKIKTRIKKMKNIKNYYGKIKYYSKLAARIIVIAAQLSAHAVAGYVFLTQFDQTFMFGYGLYFAITAGMAFAAIVIKASKQ